MCQALVRSGHGTTAKLRLWRPLTLLFVSEWDPGDPSVLAARAAGMPGIHKLLLGCAQAGHKVCYVCASPNPQIEGARTHGQITVYGVRLRPRVPRSFVLRHLPWRRFLWRLIVFTRLLTIGRKCKPDLICCFYPTHAFEAFLVAGLLRAPFILRLFGIMSYPVFFEKFSLAGLYRVLPEVMAAMLPSDHIVVCNDGTGADEVFRKLRAPLRRMHFWYGGVDEALFGPPAGVLVSREMLAIPRDAFVLLTLSRLESWKRVDRVIRALPAILRKHPETVLVVAGSGQMRDQYRRMADSLEVSHRVLFLGAIPHAQIPSLFAAADIFVSLYDRSNLCSPVMEAMAAGKCIVTLNVGGTADLIRNGQNAVLLERADLRRLADVICQLIENPQARERLERTARSYARIHLQTWSDRILKEINLIERTCGIALSEVRLLL